MTDLRMDEVFVINVVDLLGFDDLPLVQKFQGYVLSRFFVLSDLHLTESSLAEDSSHFVVFEFQFSDCLTLSFSHRIFLNIDYNTNRKQLFFYNPD